MAGATVLNRFEIGERLGTGGYGTVYRAWDRTLEREVAVKVIETVPASGPRIQREAQAAARLNHPGIVALFEFVHHEYGDEGGRAYLVSELVEGETVRELIDLDALSDREIAELGADLCEALDHAHDRGVVHRDIKPANLIIPRTGHGAKLMDFGIARLIGGDDLTEPGDVLGTLAYMSPEQARGLDTGPPGDLYSLALTLYEAWSGENPRRHPTPAATLRAMDLPPPELARLRPDLPAGLTGLIDACLDPEPGCRPGVEDLGRGLEAAIPRLSRMVPGPGAGSARLSAPRPAAGLATIMASLVIAGAAAACLAFSGAADPGSIVLAFVAVAAVSLVSARAGYLLAAAGTAAWLAWVAGLPGAAALLAIAALPAGLLLREDGRVLALVGAGPLLGIAGLAPGAALLAAIARDRRDRAVLAATSLAVTALAGTVAGRPLLPGSLPEVPAGWSVSVADALTGVLLPVLATPAFFLALPVWVLLAVAAGAVARRSTEGRRRAMSLGSDTIPRIDPFENELLP